MNHKISYYYKYNFISPEPLFTKVKEELRSYFQTGVIDDVLFPTYVEKALKKLGRSSYKIENNIFKLEDYETRLPDNFKGVRELWLTSSSNQSYQMPSAHYEQDTFRITPHGNRCVEANICAPEEIKITYKTTNTVVQSYQCTHLLKPGNVNARENCSPDSINRYSDSIDSFDIRGGKIVTNFPNGTLYMVYYVEERDENEFQLVPDNERIIDYLEAELKYRCFENIYNNISDETLKQIEGKMIYYERKRDEALAEAKTEIRLQTLEKQVAATKAARNRFNKYQIT